MYNCVRSWRANFVKAMLIIDDYRLVGWLRLLLYTYRNRKRIDQALTVGTVALWEANYRLIDCACEATVRPDTKIDRIGEARKTV